MTTLDLPSAQLAKRFAEARREFPALARTHNGRPAVFLDGPAGSQVPRTVIDAMAEYLSMRNANCGGVYSTSRESDAMLADARRAMADFLGVTDSESIAWGANMTSLTFAVSRALARTWSPGDQVLVTRIDHDGNVSPWSLAARDSGATLVEVDIRDDDLTLDLDDLRAKLNPRVKLLAFGGASNAVGTIHPIAQITRMAHEVGAEVYLDAVHYAPHALIDAATWGCDFVVCSAYKFFGPHVGVLWGRRERLEALVADKLRVAPNGLPGKWMTGTQNHEGIAGVRAAVGYLAELGRRLDPSAADGRGAIEAALAGIGRYEAELSRQFIERIAGLSSYTMLGVRDPGRLGERVPTFGVLHRRRSPAELATHLADRGIFAFYGNFYALPLTERLGLEPTGMLRIGFLHYNTSEEIDRLIAALAELN
jgi:cysteine desulfurase family protein (TIGR01976 family)